MQPIPFIGVSLISIYCPGDLESLLAQSLILLLLQIKREEPILPCGLLGIESKPCTATCVLGGVTLKVWDRKTGQSGMQSAVDN